MSLTLPSDFTTRSRIRLEDFVVLVEIYYNDTDSYKLATKSCIVSDVQYLGIIEDSGTFSEVWNVFEDNSVSLSVPEITIIDYTSEADLDGSFRFSDLLASNGVIGNSIKIYYGFIGTALSQFLKVFDGTVENVTIDDKIGIACKSNELPDTLINGRKLSWADQELGGEAVPTGVFIPQDADGLYLPVPFGNHWNAPLVCFNKVDYESSNYSSFETHWAEMDVEYNSALMSSTQSQIITCTQPNTLTNTPKLLVYQEGIQPAYNPRLDDSPNTKQLDGYVPIYEYAYRGGQNFDTQWYSTDSGGFNAPGVKINVPTSLTGFNLDNTVFASVPLRLYRQSESMNIQGQDSADSDEALANIFDGDDSTYWSMTVDGGENGSMWVSVEAPLDRNLRTDENYRVYKNRPIWTPESDDEYTTLVMGRYEISRTNTSSANTASYVEAYMWSFLGETPPVSEGNDWIGVGTDSWQNGNAWQNFVGLTYFGREGVIPYSGNADYANNLGYNYNSKPFVRNFNSTDSHLIDFGSDRIGNRPWYETFVAPAGNDIGTDPEVHSYVLANMGGYPQLRRAALNQDLKAILQYSPRTSTGSITMEIWNTYLESFENLSYDHGSSLYTALKGVMVGDPENDMLSVPNGSGNNYNLQRPIEYLEFIYRSKLDAEEADFNYNEWALGDDDWTEVYGAKRTGSGFVIVDETQMNQFVKEYCEDELFTSYRDNRNLLRFSLFPKDPLTISGTPTVISHSDLTNYKTYFSPISKLAAEVKSVLTDYVYADGTFVNNTSWAVNDLFYDYNYWKRDNTSTNNTLIKDKIERKYTSYVKPDLVTYGGFAWTCQRTGTTSTPGTNSDWVKCPEISGAYGSVSAFSDSASYIGVDAEANAVASLYLNQYANLHRMVDIETSNKEYLSLEIGDICEFSGMPRKCLGLTFKGWDGDTSTTYQTVNGQKCTYKFIVTSISREAETVRATLVNLHNLTDLSVKRTK